MSLDREVVRITRLSADALTASRWIAREQMRSDDELLWRISSCRDAYAEHWKTQFETMDQSLTKLAAEQKLSRVAMDDFRRYKDMQKWYLDVADMLTYITDVLTPHGFDQIVMDDFAQLRQTLSGRR